MISRNVVVLASMLQQKGYTFRIFEKQFMPVAVECALYNSCARGIGGPPEGIWHIILYGRVPASSDGRNNLGVACQQACKKELNDGWVPTLPGRWVKAYQTPCPPFECPLTSQRSASKPGPVHSERSIHSDTADIAASTSANPQICQSSPDL